MLDRRASTRRRTLLEGRIEIDTLNGWTIECPVRNVGEGGACLAVPENVVVPGGFTLAISGKAPRPARLVWYGKGRAGIAFTSRAA